MLRVLSALKRRITGHRRPEPATGGGRPAPPRRQPTQMELDLYGAIVGKLPREDLNDPDAPPSPPGAPRPNVHVRLSPRRPLWRQTPVRVWDRCRALLDGAEWAFPMSRRARAAWLEICRRLTRAKADDTRANSGKRGSSGKRASGKRAKRK